MYLSACKDSKNENQQIMEQIEPKNKTVSEFKAKRNAQLIIVIWINIKMGQMWLDVSKVFIMNPSCSKIVEFGLLLKSNYYSMTLKSLHFSHLYIYIYVIYIYIYVLYIYTMYIGRI